MSLILQRVGVAVVIVVAAMAAWGAVAVSQLGYLWPAPLILPDSISFHGGPYYKQAGCHLRRWCDQHGGLRGAQTAQRLGTLTSALVIGGQPEYSLHRRAHDGYVLVPSGDCFVMYLSNAA